MRPRTRRPAELDLSPAVERAAEAARQHAERHGGGPVRSHHWVLGLLSEDEGKPTLLLEKLGVSISAFRSAVEASPAEFTALLQEALLTASQELAILLRGDATLTTDFVLLATLDADPALRGLAAEHGIRVETIRRTLLSPDIEMPQFAEPAEEPKPSPPPAKPVAEVPVRRTPGDFPTSPLTPFSSGEKGTSTDDRGTAARIVDANLNRAREALRVVEDYCRFGRNDRFLAESLKQLRHRLASAAERLSSRELLAARDTLGDVGTTIATASEYHRESGSAVAAANLKRLQEALRSIEEHGKVLDAEFSRAIEPLRYEAYTLERAIHRGGDAHSRLATARLYLLLAAESCRHGLERTIFEAAAGGVDIVQLREKSLIDTVLLERARLVRCWTREAGVLFVINDRPDIARLVEADGVHLGQDDLPVAAARQIVGPDVFIGVSTHDLGQVRAAILDGADLIGIGPTFPSTTKAFSQFAGLAFVKEVAEETSLPAFVLGGVNRDNLQNVLQAGGRRVAVSAAITQADNPRQATAELKSILDNVPNPVLDFSS